MRSIRRLAFAASAFTSIAAAAPAFAACTSPGLLVIDGSGANQTTAALACPTQLYTEHIAVGQDGSGNIHVFSTDSSGDLNVVLTGSSTVSIGGTLPAFASTPSFTDTNFPSTVATGAGASSASTIRFEPTSSAAADGGYAKEAGGHLAAIDTSTAAGATAANQTAVQANAGSSASKGVGVQGIASGLPVYISPRIVTVTGTFTPASTGYTVGQDIGGALSVAGGVGNSTPIRIRNVTVAWTAASTTAQAGINTFFFTAAPTTTLTDGSVPTWNTADSAKLAAVLAVVNDNTATSTGLFMTNTTQPPVPRDAVTDSSGNIDLALFSNGTITYATPGTATYRIVFEY